MARRDKGVPAGLSGKTVLVARLSALGDIALSLPLLYRVCRNFDDIRFLFLTKPRMDGLFVNAPSNLTVLAVDFTEYHGAAGIWRLVSRLCGEYRVDLFVDLHDVLRTKLLRCFLKLRGVRCAHIDKGRAEKRALTRRHDKRLGQLKTSVRRYLETFCRAGLSLSVDIAREIVSPSSPPCTAYAPSEGPEEAFAAVSQPKAAGEYWLAVAPFAAHEGKMYPLQLMDKVVKLFAARRNVRIFLFGFGEKEKEEIEILRKGCVDNTVNMARACLGLGAELALLSHCDAMLSMDSANMHLASLVGLRAISIWGATHPDAGFYGAGQDPADAVQTELPCRPCSIFGSEPCRRGDYACLTQITPEKIVSAISRDYHGNKNKNKFIMTP